MKPPLKTFKPPEKGKQREVTGAYEYNGRVTMLDARVIEPKQRAFKYFQRTIKNLERFAKKLCIMHINEFCRKKFGKFAIKFSEKKLTN